MNDARGLRGWGDRTRPEDIAVMDYHAPSKHLLLNGLVTIVYMNTKQETKDIPGYADKLEENMKLYAYKTLERPVATIHGGKTHSCALRGGGWGTSRSSCIVISSLPCRASGKSRT